MGKGRGQAKSIVEVTNTTASHTIYFEHRSGATVRALPTHGRGRLVLFPPALKIHTSFLTQSTTQMLVRFQETMPGHRCRGSFGTRSAIVELFPAIRAKTEMAFATSTLYRGDVGVALCFVSNTACGCLHWHLDVLAALGAGVKKRVVVCDLV